MTEYVYLLTSPERYKIGWSYHPSTRRQALSKQSGLDLELTAMFRGDKFDEAGAHKRFDFFALGGEWFRPAAIILSWFEGHPGYIHPGRRYRPNFTPEYEKEIRWLEDRLSQYETHRGFVCSCGFYKAFHCTAEDCVLVRTKEGK